MWEWITVIMHAYKVFYFFTHYVRNAIILSHRPTKSNNKKTIGKKSTHHLNFDMGLTIKSLTSWGEPHLNSNHSFDGSYEAKSFSVGLFFGYSVANATISTSMKLKFVDLFLHVICCRLSIWNAMSKIQLLNNFSSSSWAVVSTSTIPMKCWVAMFIDISNLKTGKEKRLMIWI